MSVLTFLQGIGAHVGGWLYVIAAVLAFGEAAVMIGLVLPGETALLVAGYAAHHGWIHLVPAMIIGVVAAILGDTVGYAIGRHWGPRLRRSRLGERVGADRWDRVEHLIRRHGGKAVLVGRSTAVLRALTPGVAGMARMPFLRTFLPWNVAGGIAWGAGCVALGYALAASVNTVGHYLSYGPTALMAIVVAVLAVRTWRKRRRPAGATPR
jgi:membrane protein DedA with SNARE-associated domain